MEATKLFSVVGVGFRVQSQGVPVSAVAPKLGHRSRERERGTYIYICIYIYAQRDISCFFFFFLKSQ